MSNELQQRRTAPPTLRARVQGMANAMLVDMVGETKAAEAGARTALAFAAAHRAAKDPSQIERCSPESIAACVATSALTGLMPGGPNPLCWLIPKGGQLTWMPSHRGLTVLAQRAGYQIVPVAVGPCDAMSGSMARPRSRMRAGGPSSIANRSGAWTRAHTSHGGAHGDRPRRPLAVVLPMAPAAVRSMRAASHSSRPA
eukprot:GHVO01036193.1.p1 GENE.GHVO01036193.1~~GHVO01036193.1.p1  ORF type:complete len:199 (+),score=19.45 GHVO01036193.1:282-878(+)